ncbi:MAG: polysaccharide biosynthesis/export family protein [Sphingomonadaceae bacterium]
MELSELPTPVRADLETPGRPYVLGPSDSLNIDVYGVEDMNREKIQLDASGRLAFPFAGTIDANGMTLQELTEALTSRLSRYVRNPQVTVNLAEATNSTMTIDGQVRKPGIYPVLGRMTLMRAVASAEGLAEYAKVEEVVVFRKMQGQEYAGLYDLAAIRRGAYGDPEIFANDVVVVGDTPSRRLIRDLVQAAPILGSAIITVLLR